MNERQRNLRLQGRYQPRKSSVSQKLSTLKLDSNEEIPKNSDLSKLASVPAQNFSYEKTNQEKLISKPKGPKVMNDSKELIGEWIELDSSRLGSRIYYDPTFLNPEDADELFSSIRKDVKFEKRTVIINGEEHIQPRLVHWIGPHEYKYSSLSLMPNDTWPSSISFVRDCLMTVPGLEAGFNSVLCNLYRNGKDSVAWHSDNELSMGVKPLIASVSLGATRKFEMKRKRLVNQSELDTACKSSCPPKTVFENDDPEWCVHLEHGSLFIMDGTTQENWLSSNGITYMGEKVSQQLTTSNEDLNTVLAKMDFILYSA